MDKEQKQAKSKCIIFHRWSVWEDFDKPYGSENIHIMQIKECLDCGKKKGRSMAYTKGVR